MTLPLEDDYTHPFQFSAPIPEELKREILKCPLFSAVTS
jgi:hypothetical protein